MKLFFIGSDVKIHIDAQQFNAGYYGDNLNVFRVKLLDVTDGT